VCVEVFFLFFFSGSKTTEVGLAFYDKCREHGAIIATGHEHSYARSYEMSSFVNLTHKTDAHSIILDKGKTFAFCNGLGGLDVRGWEGGLEMNSWWASVGATNVRY